MKCPLVFLALGALNVQAAVLTSFEEESLPAAIFLDVPRPTFGGVVFDAVNDELDFTASGNTDMWSIRNNAAIAWTAIPAGLTPGSKWVVETEVRLNNVVQNNQVAGLTFYGGPDGARPDISFGLDNWDPAARAVRLQGLGDNVPNAAVTTTAASVILRVEVTEEGATDTYNFFFREQAGDPWTQLPGAAVDYRTAFANARVGLTYKTGAAKAGAAFTFFYVVGGANEPPLITSQPAAVAAVEGGLARFMVGELGAATYQWRRNGTPLAAGGAQATLVIEPVTAADSGASYDCVLTNAGGSTTSAAATVTVSPRPAGGSFYTSAVQAEPSLFAYFPVDGSPAAVVTNVRNPGLSGLPRGSAVQDSHPERTVGAKSLATGAAGWMEVPREDAWDFVDGSGTIELFAHQAAGTVYNPGLVSVRTETATRYSLKADAAGAKIHFTTGAISPFWTLPVSSIGRLMHLALVIDQGQGTLYHNGLSLGTINLTLGTAKNGSVTIGSTGPGSQHSFPGSLDEVAVYADPLPAAAVSAHYNAWITTAPGTAPVVSTQPASVAVDEGGTAVFTVALADATNAEYRWQQNGVDIAGATGPSVSLSPVTLTDTASAIRCIIYNRHGGALTDAAVLTVNDITSPRLLSAASPLSVAQVLLTFDEAVDPDGAAFSIAGGTVTAAAAGPLPGMLTLTVSGLTPGQGYTLTATGVRDLAGNILASTNTAFTAAAPPVPAPIELVRPAAEPIGPATRRGPFVFSEIHYHPRDRADAKNLEFIELYNSQPWVEDVSGFRLTGEVNFTLPAGTSIPAGGRLVLAAAPADVMSVYSLTGVLGPWAGSLNNSGGQVRLRDISNAVVFSVDYDAGAPWPAAPDGTGHSLVLARPSYGMEDPRSWEASFQPDGSPGAAEPVAEDPFRTVLINEAGAASEADDDFIELFNYSALAVDVSGCTLSDDRETGKFVLPAGTHIGPGQWRHVSRAELGFGLKAGGDTVYFRAPNGPEGTPGRVLEAMRFGPQRPGTTHGRHPDGVPVFSSLHAASPGTANAAPAAKAAVISEIHYHPPVGSAQPPFVEVTNTSGAPLDLSGWRLRGGVSYDVPPGTVLAADGQLALTGFSGSLNRGTGARLRLEQPVAILDDEGLSGTIHPVIDEVTYGTGGRWGRWSDGGGASLELQDLRSDGRLASNWADSEDTGEGGWVTIEATGVLTSGSGSLGNRLHVFLLGAGECLLDDVEVRSATGPNLVANGGFEGGTTGWLLQGTHDASSIEATGFSGNSSLHVRATGRGNLAGNRLTVPLTTAPATGATATLRAKVKWLHGHPEILLRLQGGILEATGSILPATLTPGTPGAPNSRALANAGPAISGVTHLPVLPQAGQPATVYARLADPDGITLARLHYRLDPSTTVETLSMTDRGAGLFSAELPAQTTGRLVAFTVTAYDGLAASTTFPANGREALIRWGEPTPPGSLGTYRFWMTDATRSTWTTRIKNSNTPLDVTFLYGNTRVIYNAGAQYSGSPWHTGGFTGPTGAACDYVCSMPDDDRLLGATDFLFAGPGTFGDDASLIREQTIWWMARRLGTQSLHRRFGRVYVNGTRRQTLFEDAQQPNGEWIDSYWPGDDNGRLHKAQDWIEYEDDGATFQTTLRALMEKRTRTGGAHDVAAYRFQWAQRSVPGSVNDWSDFTTLVDAFNTGATATDPAFFNALDPLVDQDSWARAFAIQRISGNWDTWGWRFGKNMYLYKPQRGPWTMTAWDIDFSFGLVGEPATAGLFDDTQDPLCTKFRNQPAFRRAYWCAFREAVDGPMLAATVNARIDAMVAGLAANGVNATASQVSAVKSYISSRRSYIVSQLNAVYSTVALALNGSSTLTDEDGVVTLTGTAPPGVKSLRINGVEQTPQWTSQTAWRLPVTLYAQNNTLAIEGMDRRGQVIGSFPVTITVTGQPPLRAVTLNEWMADNPTSTGIADPADGRADDWFEVFNAGTTPADLSGFLLSDDPSTPAAFQIPAGTIIPPGGHLLVWADGEPEQNGLTPGQLHTPFRLSAAGESLRLSTPEGTVVDAVTFGPQTAGVSEGRYADGGPITGPLTLPTPASPNALTVVSGWAWEGAALRFTVQTTPGFTYQLEASPSLGAWAPVGAARPAAGSTLTLDDPAAAPGTTRFYRVLTRK